MTDQQLIEISERKEDWHFDGSFSVAPSIFFELELPDCINFTDSSIIFEKIFPEVFEQFKDESTSNSCWKPQKIVPKGLKVHIEGDFSIHIPYASPEEHTKDIIREAHKEWEHYSNHLISLIQKSLKGNSLATQIEEFLPPDMDHEVISKNDCIFMTCQIRMIRVDTCIKTITGFLVVCWKIERDGIKKINTTMKAAFLNS